MTQYSITHTTVAEVYEDGILIRGRNCSSGEWISLAQSEMLFKKPCASGKIRIEKAENSDNLTLFANAENMQNICFEWYLNGQLVSNESKISILPEFNGYIALRAKDSFGGFRSVIYDHINT